MLGKTLLLVEDEVFIAMNEERQLSSRGYNVFHAASGEEAVNLVLNNDEPIDLILMDIDLGSGIDGTEAAEQILANKDIPVVFLSSHTEPEVVEKTEKITSYGYVVKQSGIVVLDASIKMAFKLFEARQRVQENEIAVIQSEELFRTLFDQAAVGVAQVLQDGMLTMVNARFCEIIGYTREELSNINFRDITHPDDVSLDDESIQRVIAGEIDSFEIEKRYIHKAGHAVWIQLYSNVVRDETGTIKYAIAVVTDISNKKEADQNIHFLSSITEQVNDSIIVTDKEFKITYINKAGERLYGYSINEILGKTPALFNAEPMSNQLQQELYSSVMNGNNFESTWLNKRKDGSTFYCNFRISVLCADDGDIIGYIGIQRDISDIKRSEELLRESESSVRRKLKAITEPSGDIGALELVDIIDTNSIKAMMEDLYNVTGIGSAIVDMKGNVLVGVGWQDICTKYHRVNPETEKHCVESDIRLSSGINTGEFKAYKCRNNMWDMASPIVIGNKHMGNFFLGQYFYDDEEVDRELFRQQARRYGFNEDEYLAALDRVPRYKKEVLNKTMSFYTRLAGLISQLSYSNIKLANSVSQLQRAQETNNRKL